MTKENLAELLKSILEIELFIDNYEALRQKTLNPPVKATPPKKPEYPRAQMKRINEPIKKSVDLKSLFIKIILGVFLIGFYADDPDPAVLYIPVIGLLLLAVYAIYPIYNENQRYSKALAQYQKDVDAERLRCQTEDQKAKEKIDNEYNQKLKEYDYQFNKEYEEYQSNLKTINELKETRRNAEAKLNDLYNEIAIHPKYRNINAIGAFYDFISTGRCNVLEGRDGAYNLYEEQLQREKSENEIKRLEAVIEKLQKDLDREREINHMNLQHASFMRSVDNFNLQMSLRESIHDLGTHIGRLL
ncbi:MAG: hypothetical protein IJB74_06225 [Clostridia bacterium]|nr:hypothetical protein [Clostridia bacterium]